MSDTIRCVVIPPCCEPRVLEFNANDYRQLQAIVGGTIASSQVTDRIAVYYHDEGLLIGLQPNVLTATGALLVGNLVVAKMDDDGDEIDMTTEDVALVDAWLAQCKRPGAVEYSIPDPIIVSGASHFETAAALEAALASHPHVRVLGIDTEGVS